MSQYETHAAFIPKKFFFFFFNKGGGTGTKKNPHDSGLPPLLLLRAANSHALANLHCAHTLTLPHLGLVRKKSESDAFQRLQTEQMLKAP